MALFLLVGRGIRGKIKSTYVYTTKNSGEPPAWQPPRTRGTRQHIGVSTIGLTAALDRVADRHGVADCGGGRAVEL